MKYLATVLFCVAVLVFSNEKIREEEKNCKELCEILLFIRHVKREIGTFLKPLLKALEDFKAESDALTSLILAVGKGENIKDAYLRLSDKFLVTDEIKAGMLKVFGTLSDSYFEESIKVLDSFEKELSERCRELEKKRAENAKVIQIVSATLCIAVIIAVI